MFEFLKSKKSKQKREDGLDPAERRLETHLHAFKLANKSKGLHYAAKVVRDFIVWQHNFAQIDRLEALDNDIDLTQHQEEKAEQVERAFLIGAAGVAAEYFSVTRSQENLFLLNVIGTYKGLGPGLAEAELGLMFDASDAEPQAASLGGSVMMHCLAYGNSDDLKIHLAALQRRVWT